MARKKSDKPKMPDYLSKILAFPPLRSTVVVAHVYHEDGCAIWRGGVCDCKPEIVYEYPNLAEVKDEANT